MASAKIGVAGRSSPCGRMKLATNRCDLGARAVGIAQAIAQLPDVLVERRRHPQKAAVLGQEVMEVNRPFLRARKLLGQQREDRTAE